MIHFVSACLPKADNIRTSGLFLFLERNILGFGASYG